MKTLVGATCGFLLLVASCSGSPSTVERSTSPSTDASVAVVVERYGDCLTAIGDSLDGQVLPSSTGAHTHVGFGPKPVIFSVTDLNGKTYVVPLDNDSARVLSKGGDTC